jgi:hypothetical protein
LNEFLDSAQRTEFDTYPGTPAKNGTPRTQTGVSVRATMVSRQQRLAQTQIASPSVRSMTALKSVTILDFTHHAASGETGPV